MAVSATDLLLAAVNPAGTRIQQLPPIILVYGGALGGPHSSARQFFLNWMMLSGSPIKSFLRTPEQFQDWNQFEGYGNLVDFERDAGHLTRAIVLFSESEGAFAELGAFCMDEVISERLFVVIEKQFYHADSFIAHGPIKKIEDHHHDHSICVMDSLDPKEMDAGLHDLVADLEEKISSISKTQIFDSKRHRDQFLLVADLVELFGALKVVEIDSLLKAMGVELQHNQLRSILNQLKRFELVELVEGATKRFYVPPKDRHVYLNYEGPEQGAPFDRSRFKMVKVLPWLRSESSRLKAYNEIHMKM